LTKCTCQYNCCCCRCCNGSCKLDRDAVPKNLCQGTSEGCKSCPRNSCSWL